MEKYELVSRRDQLFFNVLEFPSILLGSFQYGKSIIFLYYYFLLFRLFFIIFLVKVFSFSLPDY